MIDYWGRETTQRSVEPVHLQIQGILERWHLVDERTVGVTQFEVADREQLRPFGGAVDLDASQYIGRLPGARLVDVRSRRLCLNAIEATQHRRVKDRAPNAYDQQQAAQRRASEIAMAQQQQAVMAQQTSPARVLGSR